MNDWRQWCAFDLEIATSLPEGDSWQDNPGFLGITCAATVKNDRSPVKFPTSTPFPDMFSEAEALELFVHLQIAESFGYKIVTWNGMSFDFRILADLVPSRFRTSCKRLALDHIDIGFQMVCERGFMVGLNTAAEALDVGSKTEGMSGALAPVLWGGWPNSMEPEQVDDFMTSIKDLGVEPGTEGARRLCLDYVANDAILTGQVYHELLSRQSLIWITKSGRKCRTPWVPRTQDDDPPRLLTVRECLELPQVDVSWMTDPRPREAYWGWADA